MSTSRSFSRKSGASRVALCGLLLAMMLVTGYLEHLLPSPGIPGIKFGLSNSILIFAVYLLDIPTAWILMVLKVLLSGLLFSGVQAMMYAFAGGLLSLTGMCILSCFRKVPVPVVSMLGGFLHNAGQLLVAMLIVHISSLVYWLVLTLTGLACGLLTGFIAVRCIALLKTSGLFDRPKASARKSAAVIAVAVLLSAGMIVLCVNNYNRTKPAGLLTPAENGDLLLTELPLPQSSDPE